MKIPNVLRAARTGNRVGRDRRPRARWTYALWTVFWAVMTGLYGVGLASPKGANDLWGDPMGLVWTWFFSAVSVLFLLGNARIWLQYEGRVTEWATHVREHNAATRARLSKEV